MEPIIFLVKFKLYPSEIKSTVLNSDWIYRKMLPGIGKPLFQNLQKIIIKFYDLLSILFDLILGRSKKFANSSYIKVTTPGFAGLLMITILFIMLVIAVI